MMHVESASTAGQLAYSVFVHYMRLPRPRTMFTRRLLCYRKLCGLCCSRPLLAFLLGMVCLELLASYTGQVPWPLELELGGSRPVAAAAVSTRRHTGLSLSSDDLLSIQEGSMRPDDPRLLEYIRRQLLYPSHQVLNLTQLSVLDRSSAGQALLVDKLLSAKRGGFFVECGAGDGELMSDTLYLERRRNWTGLLIEPHPQEFDSLLYKRRRAYSLNMCVSPSNTSSLRVLRAARQLLSGLKDYVDSLHTGQDFSRSAHFQGDILVQCVPFAPIVQALGLRHIDYLSLSVAGAEVDVLRSMPLDSVRIEAISAQYVAHGAAWDQETRSRQRLADIRTAVQQTGLYREVGILIAQPELALVSHKQFREKYGSHVIFVRKDFGGIPD